MHLAVSSNATKNAKPCWLFLKKYYNAIIIHGHLFISNNLLDQEVNVLSVKYKWLITGFVKLESSCFCRIWLTSADGTWSTQY